MTNLANVAFSAICLFGKAEGGITCHVSIITFHKAVACAL